MKSKKAIVIFAALFMLFSAVSTQAGAAAVDTSIPEDATIVRTGEDWPTYYDPAVGSDYSDSTTQCNVYDPLVFPQQDGSIKPHLATGWTVSDNNLVYTFTLRDDVKFHSGNLMKASDVAYSMNRLLEIGEGYAYLYKDVIGKCYAPDDTHVVFELKTPFGPFVYALIRFMVVEEALVTANYDKSAATYGEKGDYGKTWLLTHDAGSGPYKTREFKLDEYFLGERFDDYFLGWNADAPQYFKISNMTDPVAVRTAMANKELEITDELQPLENYNTMDAMDGVDLAAFSNSNTFNMMFNTKAEFSDDVHLRKAVAYAFDYDTLRESIYPGALESRGPVAVVLPGFDKTIPAFKQDMEKAKAELAQSKYAGQNITLNLTWCAEVPEQEKIALLLQSNLSELGINLAVTKKPFGSMITDAQSPDTTPQISFVNFASPYFEAGGMLRTRYHSSSCGSWEQMEWLQDSKLDKMIDDALATVDDAERFKKYAEIQRYIFDLCPTVWGFNWLEKRAAQTSYLTWNAVTATEKGENYFMPMGFAIYAHDMTIKK
ncbi:MAG: ABC transporter substrate-binding protein [Synergistaceae bacterium]|jgi:peptide/nickel transport system substrate-binding protein|nr:ABC transporter substrate-binding protein [Synergistaceae bacterium]